MLIRALQLKFTIVLALLISFEDRANAQSFQCPSNPQIGDQCTQRVTIRLRKLESEGRDEFNQRFEPDAGWVVEDCDTRIGERKRTGEVSGPSCVKVQAGNALTSQNFVDTQVRQLSEHMEKLKIQFGKLPIFADIESKARNEFSSVQQNLQSIQTSNSGVNISAWVSVQGGCRTRSPFGCINWGPGGSLDTDVIVRLKYVGTNQDISRILERYTTEADRAALTSRLSSVDPSCKNNNIVIKPDNNNLEFPRGSEWNTCSGYKFVFQNDGNLVLYNPSGQAIWNTATDQSSANKFVVQTDGNIVLYNSSGQAIWDACTGGNSGAVLAIQWDGNVVIYDRSGKPIWFTQTTGR